MKKLITILAAGAFLFAGASHLQAQDSPDAAVEVLVVEGYVINPGSVEPMELNFEFSGSGDDLAAAITVPGVEGLRVEMNDLLVTDELFSFSFVEPTGTQVIECSLDRLSDDSFRGECFADDGNAEMGIDAFEE